ncbi:MAG: hypothetical protein U9R50_11710 [Campylobacterota bacterium]|nr:hypothetical protein [Campylobacterota bacterium]
MKIKLLTILLISSIEIFASKISILQTLYDKQEYHEVIKVAKNNYSLYSNPNLHLLWAKSAEALGDDISAMSAYERVLMINPNHTDAQVALVYLYKKLNRESLSQELRATLLTQELSPSTRAALAVAYDDFSQKLSVSAKISLGHDSNIGANSNDGITTQEYDDAIETLFTRASVQANYIHYLSTQWFWQGDAQLYAQNNNDADFYNLYNGSAALGLGYKDDAFTLFFPLSYGRMYYFEHDFLQQYGVYPYLNITLTPSIILNFNFKYLQRRFIKPEYQIQNDDVLGTSAGVFWYFDQGFTYIKGGYDTYSAQENTPLYFTDKQVLHSDIGVSTFIDRYIFRADYHFEYSNFDDTFESQTDANKKRTDTYHRIDLKTGLVFYDQWSLNLEYAYTNNDSQYKYASYDKHVMMTSLQLSY